MLTRRERREGLEPSQDVEMSIWLIENAEGNGKELMWTAAPGGGQLLL